MTFESKFLSRTGDIGRQIIGVIQLVRPVNLILAVAGVAVGASLSAGPGEAFSSGNVASVVVAMLSALAIGSAANAVNDLYDVDIDRINRPDRPIPSGIVDPRVARTVWWSGAVAGLGLSLPLSAAHLAIALFAVVAVFVYSYRLKQIPLVGNFLVALVVSLAIIYGGLATGQVGLSWVGAIAAFLLSLAREITKDLEDIDGDRANGVKSLPIAFGTRSARTVVLILIAVTIAASPLPFTHLSFSGLYLFSVLVAGLLLLFAIWLLGGTPARSNYKRASFMLKSAMIVGMAGLVVA